MLSDANDAKNLLGVDSNTSEKKTEKREREREREINSEVSARTT